MKRVISFVSITSLSFLITGCGAPALQPHKPTMDYAKQHNLSNKDYQESEIMCISDKTLTTEEKMDIFLAGSKKFHHDFSPQKCKNSYTNGLKYGKPQDIGEYHKDYNKCKGENIQASLTKSKYAHFKKYDDKSFKIEYRYYHGFINPKDTEKGLLYGYIGFDDKDNHTIVYVADSTNEEKYIDKPSNFGFIKDGVLNYMDTHPNKCNPVDL